MTDREIVIRRVLDAPPDVVFSLWTDPRHLVHWWGPNGFTTEVHEMDVRVGGTWRLTMRGPDGRLYNNRIVFKEVLRPERLVYQHTPEHGSEPVSFETTVTFAARAGKTEVTLRMLFPTAEQREHVVKVYGAIEGAEQTLGRLAGYAVDALKWGLGREIRITRVIDAPREVVFAAWTDPEQLREWWGPKGFTNPRCEADVRPGGAIRIDMCAPDGTVYPMAGQYLEIAPPERLVLLTGALGKDGQKLFEARHEVTFEALGEKTRLTLLGKRVMATAEGVKSLEGAREGWNGSFDRLAEFTARVSR